MFEDYFMQMLNATAPQMVYPLSPIWNTLSNISAGITRILASVLSSKASIEAGLCIDMSSNTAPQKIV